MSTQMTWPPPRKARKARRHCAKHAGGHNMVIRETTGGRTIQACTRCGERGYEITTRQGR